MNELVIMEDGVEDGCWMLETGCWMLDAGDWILDAGCLSTPIKFQNNLCALCFLTCFA